MASFTWMERTNIMRWLLLFLILVLALPVQAQPDDWELLFYDLQQISVLTSDGIVDQIPVPAGAQGITPFTGLRHMRLAPDRQHLAFVQRQGSSEGGVPLATVAVADLEAQTCCVTLPVPDGMQPDSTTVGPFSPDGTQIAINYAQVYSPVEAAPVLVIIDLETQTIVQTLDLWQTFQNQGVFMHDWTAAGITLFPTCLACGGAVEGYYSRWNPETGTITPDVLYFNWLGDYLDGTNNYVIPVRDESRPVSHDDGMFPPANTLEYVADGNPASGTVVYFDPDRLDLPYPRWVQGGAAYLLHNWGEPTALLVGRDGTEQVIELPHDLHFVAATPDGWLMQQNESDLYHFQVTANQQVTSTVWEDISGSVTILETPAVNAEDLLAVTPIIKG
jgi:hypothetical protein